MMILYIVTLVFQLVYSLNFKLGFKFITLTYNEAFPDSKVHGANMGPTWILSAPDGPHVGPMKLAIRVNAF